MNEIRSARLIPVAEYLASQSPSLGRHEYLEGSIYELESGSDVHNQIATNLLGALVRRLCGRSGRAFPSDTKVRVQSPFGTRFYYPDAQVVRLLNAPSDGFQDSPVVLVEVVSPSTRRIDECEKREAYLTIPSLGVYLLVEEEHRLAIAWRRGEQGFVREAHTRDSVIPLPEVGCELPLAEVYDGVDPAWSAADAR